MVSIATYNFSCTTPPARQKCTSERKKLSTWIFSIRGGLPADLLFRLEWCDDGSLSATPSALLSRHFNLHGFASAGLRGPETVTRTGEVTGPTFSWVRWSWVCKNSRGIHAGVLNLKSLSMWTCRGCLSSYGPFIQTCCQKLNSLADRLARCICAVPSLKLSRCHR